MWFERLRDKQTKQIIRTRVARIRSGNLGKKRSVGAGVQELVIDYGPGYRLYFGQDGKDIVILLCGGDKSTQHEDIKKAKDYWEIFKREKSYVDGH
ncbi:MAG: type II toxin-antitoxin system RelE/ParE family toxin [Candidatus Obscuribacterales bacterium]|nr:type II toxin-antitoxin system RelE/ParE family toxin [Candidatus Obscuribacterales bacterium]